MLVIGLAVVAAINDVRAFAAIATPTLYAWFVLCGLCAAGFVSIARTRTDGVKPPLSFRVALALGVLSGLATVPATVRVLTKADDTRAAAEYGTPPDWRGQAISDSVLAGRDLRRAQARDAQLEHVDLGGSNLSEADLRGAELHDVNLSGTNLCGADLRGTDLSQARGFDAVAEWAYAFYDDSTELPDGYDLDIIEGPIPDTGRGLLYMCTPNKTRRIEPERQNAE